MGKNKKKGKKNSTFYKAVKPYIKDNRVLYSILGAAGVGVALASVFGTDKGREIIDNFTNTLKSIGGKQDAEVSGGQEPTITDKKPKAAKHFAIEPS
ncbi:hypothetical protein AHMF7605_21225 [Adhaeribacter arboris]|uniref:Uncharacterized protein n=1 Tax=Adhaeribacter arboris TaxID=2072846 RepID=A0A2T2YK12_9BACT|nr:hypothetical protein [Adhaeribacter arboris]PSR55840.1 hypothetical protein AHMF7605_21225 [Adhaeribacter arboris]